MIFLQNYFQRHSFEIKRRKRQWLDIGKNFIYKKTGINLLEEVYATQQFQNKMLGVTTRRK